MSIQFINITETEFLSKKLLYKYLPLEFALGSIKENYLWMSNPVKWKDPFERRFIKAKYQIRGKEVAFPLKGKIFCTCMTQTPTSEAHWNTYSKEEIGISLRVRREQLLQILKENDANYEIFIGKVEYLKTADLNRKLSDIEPIDKIKPFDINNRELQINLLLLKRIAFQYEDEIRILVVKKTKTNEKGIKLSYNSINSTDLISRITIDPNVSTNTEIMLKNIFKKEYKFNNVFKSQLYTMADDIKIEV